MIKYLSTIVLTVALCCACDGEDFSADPTLMPPATQTGANTFGCLIDGWVYTGQRYGPDQIGRAHVRTPVPRPSRMPASA